MSKATDRPYAVVVFGATGFTGERIALYLARLSKSGAFTSKWAIAGRSQSKLEQVRDRILAQAEIPSGSLNIDILIGDVSNASSLVSISSMTRVLISAAGPYRYMGEPVVRACIETSTHYCDVTGEPEFIEKMMLEYDESARDKHTTIVSTCGFDSIPADLGSLYTTREFYSRHPNALISQIDSFLTLNIGAYGMRGNTGTWETLVHSLSSNALLRIRKHLRSRQESSGIPVPRIGKSRPRSLFTEPRLSNKLSAKFPGADSSVVKNSQYSLAAIQQQEAKFKGKTLPYYNAYFTMSGYLSLIGLIMIGLILAIMTRFQFGRSLLLKYPSLFSLGVFSPVGPSEKQIDTCSFDMDFFASGYSDQRLSGSKADVSLHTRVSGPEIGYRTTCIAVVQSAITLLEHANKDGVIPRGVVTPAVAFYRTNLIERLDAAGVKFSVIS